MLKHVANPNALLPTLALLFLAGCRSAPVDVMAPTADTDDALTGPLHTITLITPEYSQIEKLFVQGMGLTESELHEPELAKLQRSLWGLPEAFEWETRVLSRPSAPGTTQIRVLITSEGTGSPRDSWNRQQLGPYGMGFPTLDVASWDAHLSALGYRRATEAIEIFNVSAPDGNNYEVRESAFFGPEYLRVIAISRKGGLPQVGVFDPKSGRGGPVYATQIVPNIDEIIEFFTQVLDLEVRSDRVWREYPEPFRFTLIHAKGSRTGHLAFVEYEQEYVVPGTGVSPRPPARGMSMWTFPVSDLDAIVDRANRAGATIVNGPVDYQSVSLGRHRALTLLSPNGFLIEVFETIDD